MEVVREDEQKPCGDALSRGKAEVGAVMQASLRRCDMDEMECDN